MRTIHTTDGKEIKIHTVDDIISYENGELSPNEIIELFASLIKTGQAWSLQGHYGRTATGLIENGYVSEKGDILKRYDD